MNLFNRPADGGQTLLSRAVENAKLPVIRDLVATCTSETYDDSDLQRFIACLRHFHVPFEANAVRTFIAKAYEKDEMGNNPLMKAAVERSDVEGAQLLLRFEGKGRVPPIVMAVERFDVDLAELLLAILQADPDAICSNGQSLLRFAFDRMGAYESRQGEMVALLCFHKARPYGFSDTESLALVGAKKCHYDTSDED